MSTETTQNEVSTRIDHLSRLPNELLEGIFDYAYYISPPPPLPLSKRLLPFHQKHFYRQVSLSSCSQLDNFIASVSSDKEKGKIVKAISFDRSNHGVIESIEVLEKLFPHLPNLQHFELDSGEITISSRSTNLFSTLTKITSIITEPTWENFALNLDGFAFLSNLPSLNRLEIRKWPANSTLYSDSRLVFQLPHVKTLKVEGEGAEEWTVADLVALCPALIHLEIETTWSDEIDFDKLIEKVSANLESIRLSSRAYLAEFSPRLLLRFPNLRHVDLGDGYYPDSIGVVLQQLPQLEKIRLEGGSISSSDLVSLVSAPSRVVHLKSIILDPWVGKRGRHVLESTVESLDYLEMGDWNIPRASKRHEGDEWFDWQGLKQFISVAEENGVKIEGTIHEALENLEDYWIEKNNRGILLVYNGDFDYLEELHYVHLEALEVGITLPTLDIESLDPDRLKLVKIDQPGRDWSIFSLKNRDHDQSEETELKLEPE
ncbi:hypothetical protein JCM5350_006109 [Sporobolomyces pararoseus]